ncbi:hypothetical protein DICVIV_06696 [Dictyocaulus viviparus]|uniref:Uncharacterized protein n=1 Tax=Dictyocaulus viviparus TaxID=29172 RepID=A0A0D8XTV6_DICVI|nr:hypothetical protein DICVIV_06696 [Dictyocaulus viviparus]
MTSSEPVVINTSPEKFRCHQFFNLLLKEEKKTLKQWIYRGNEKSGRTQTPANSYYSSKD